MAIKSLLLNLGLNNNQASVYLCIVRKNIITAGEISKNTGVTRTTVYDALKVLLNKGLIVEKYLDAKKVFSPDTPSKLKNLLEDQITGTNKIIKFLSSSYNPKFSKPEIQIFTSQIGIKKMHDLSLIANQKKETIFIGNTDTVFSNLSVRYIKNYIAQRIKFGIRNNVITTSNVKDIEMYSHINNRKSLREIRYLKAKALLKTGFFVYDDTVWIFTNPSEGFTIMINSKELSETIREMFSILWEIASELE